MSSDSNSAPLSVHQQNKFYNYDLTKDKYIIYDEYDSSGTKVYTIAEYDEIFDKQYVNEE